MSDPATALSLADLPVPKRERGRLRVAAILDAAVAVFSEKGYDAATMTEIAARSSTATGSLYRFFPSKEVLADALLLRFAQHVTSGLSELEAQVPRMSIDALAGALVDFMLALQSERRFAVALLDARSGSAERRGRFREATRSGIARIVQLAVDGLTPAKTQAVAITLLHLLKGVSVAADEPPAVQAILVGEIREVVRLYLTSARRHARG